jgi:hypothetical protein
VKTEFLTDKAVKRGKRMPYAGETYGIIKKSEREIFKWNIRYKR